jgi:AbrB family looped-hinge helix DNA binding protein
MKKGRCMREAVVYGVSTVSDKGQIAIPIIIRRELDLKKGDKLLIIKRSDNAGFAFIKLELMDKLMDKIRTDEKFFEKIG